MRILVLALLSAAPFPSPLLTPSRWAVAARIDSYRDAGYSPFRTDIDRNASDVVVEVLPDGGLFVGETMDGFTYAIVATQTGHDSFRLQSSNITGTWRWLNPNRAYIQFGYAAGEFVRLRPGEGMNDAEEKYLFETTKRHWPEWVGTYVARDGGVMRVEPEETIKWEGAVIRGNLSECWRNCSADAGVTTCFKSSFMGVGEGRELYLSTDHAFDGGAVLLWSVERPCHGPVEILRRQ